MKSRCKYRFCVELVAFFSVALLSGISCDKNSADPATSSIKIESLVASLTRMSYGSTVSLNVNLSGGDNSSRTFTWNCSGGEFSAGTLSDEGKSATTTSPDMSWKAPEEKGVCTVRVAVADAGSSDSSSVDLEVKGYYFEDFSESPGTWATQNCAVSASSGAAMLNIDVAKWNRFYHTFNKAIAPPYALEMNMTFTKGFKSPGEAIGCYIHNMDTGTPEAKVFGFWLFPATPAADYAMAIRTQVDPDGNWWFAEDGGSNPVVPSSANQWAKVRLTVNANRDIIIQINDTNVYQYFIENAENMVHRTIDMSLKEIGSMASAFTLPYAYKIDYVLVDKL